MAKKAKKATKKTTKKTTEKTASEIEQGLFNDLDADPEGFFDGYTIETVVGLKDGEGVKGKLMGQGEPIPYSQPDGNQVEIETWEIQVGENLVRLMGSSMLDRELGRISIEYVLPCDIAIFRIGKERTKSGFEMTRFRVGARGKRTKKPANPLS